MYVRNYDEAVKALFPHLRDYLEEHGVDLSGTHFCCINPDHDDHNPSMSILPGGHTFKCWSCGVEGGIFEAARLIEGKPTRGTEFVTETLSYLADKYDVTLDAAELTEDQLFELDTYRAYRTAANLVVNGKQTKSFDKEVEDRGWSRDTCDLFGIGSIPDYQEYRRKLEHLGFDSSFIDEVDLGRTAIFGNDRFIFTVTDDKGRPVGFAARNLNYKEDGSNGPKYVNQRGNGLRCNIFRKGERLFGISQLLERAGSTPIPVYVFEGHPDVVTAHQHGLWNSVATGGSALTREQVALLKKHNLYEIIVCMDGDDAGLDALRNIMDNVLSGHKDLSVSVVIMPAGKDPDDFIRENGVDEFRKLKKWSAFEWRLDQFPDNASDEDVCRAMIPIIVNESSYISQEKMCKTLAKSTGITLRAVRQELERLQNQKEHARSRDKQEIIDRLKWKLDKNPNEAELALREADISFYELSQRYETDAFSEDEYLSAINQQKEYEESKDGTFSGFLMPGLRNFEQCLCGDWKKNVWLVFGGKPNSGKTSLMCKMAYEIAAEEENDALVLYHTIDDSREQVNWKLVTISQGEKRLTLNHVADPNFHNRNIVGLDVEKLRTQGYNKLQQLARDGRLVVKDANNGLSLAFAEAWIKKMKEKWPNRNIVYILDNFHKLQDFTNSKADERIRFKELSKQIKGLATRYHITVITTVEYRKIEQGRMGTNADIVETGQIEYDANLIAHVHNDMHESGERSTKVHRYDYQDGYGEQRYPTIQVRVGKNKITSFKGSLWMDFFPASSDFMSVDPQVVQSRVEMEEKKLKEANSDYYAIYEGIKAQCMERGWKPGKAMYMMAEELGLDTSNKEDLDKVKGIIQPFGWSTARL